jgi:glucose/arabinose dehydrogenase
MSKSVRNLALWAAALPGLLLAQEGEYPPGTFQLTPRLDLGLAPVAVVVPEEFSGLVPEDLSVNLPPGFSAKVYAAPGLRGPRFMAWSPDGVLHVANMKAGAATEFGAAPDRKSGQIVALPDRNRDGVADTALVVAEGFWWANSLAFHDGDLYVADTHQVVRCRDGDGDGVYEERQKVADLPRAAEGEREHHVTRTLVFDKQAGQFYVSVGSTCDLCRETDPERAAILQFNADGSGRRVFARGMRNAVGLAIHPVTHQLWAVNNGHDRQGSSLPPEWIDIIREGGFYGWPLAYGYQVWVDFGIREYQKAIFPLTHQDTLDVRSMQRPVALAGAHLAPMAIHFYTQDGFPPAYRGAAFVAFRGGHSSDEPGYKVMALFAGPEGNGAQLADFLTGFEQTSGQVWGKPVGLSSDPQGNLYVGSDWINHLILKITPGLLQGAWEHQLPDSAFVGQPLQVRATVRVLRADLAGEAPVVVADLSALGGPEALRLLDAGGGEYRLETTLPLNGPAGLKRISVTITQQTAADQLITRLTHRVAVLPGEDLVVAGEGLGPGWQAEGGGGAELRLAASQVYAGNSAVAVQAVATNALRGWNADFQPPAPMDPIGYRALRFAVQVGEAVAPERGPLFSVALRPGKTINLLKEGLVEVGRPGWQVVEIPLERFELKGPFEAIRFAGNLEGAFYLDELRLVVARQPPPTAVAEEHLGVEPQALVLHQNHPNPFNSETAIRFELPQRGEIELAVYNLGGQRVATLATGTWEAGSHLVRWGGRDAQGRSLASGVYLCQLKGESRTQVRKLLLLR